MTGCETRSRCRSCCHGSGHLDNRDAVLIVNETADEKSSAEAVGAACQCSGTADGIALCQVAPRVGDATVMGLEESPASGRLN